MTTQMTHGWARTKDRQPTGYRKALCGLLAPRRSVRKAGFTCPMCQAVQNNTVASANAVGARDAGRRRNRPQDNGERGGRQGGGRR